MRKNSARLLETIIKNFSDLQLFFPNGLRGDILTKDFIDLMVRAGTINIDVALESGCPRVQKLIKKNLDLEKFYENVNYIAQTYPQVILEMEMMIGFPTETEEEALMTLEFLKKIQWVHFPNLHILKIYPNTEMAGLAIEEVEFDSGNWISQVPTLLALKRNGPVGPNGSQQIAAHICTLLDGNT